MWNTRCTMGLVFVVGLIQPFTPLAPADEDPLTFSACASATNGRLYNQRVGTTPLKPCKKGDAAVSWSQPAPLAVYDANGKKVGEVIDTENSLAWAVIAFRYGGFSFALLVPPHRLAGNTQYVYFDLPGCQGIPFLPVDLSNPYVLPQVAVAQPSGTIYLAAPDSPFLPTITVRSVRRASDYYSPGGECTPSSGTLAGVQATLVVDSDTLFTPPFSVH